MERKNTLTLKDWDDSDKPREKMIANGKKSLSEAELIGILIGSGNPGQSAVDLARDILNASGNSLSQLSRLEISELTKAHKGIGEAKAISILAALELGYRMLNETKNTKDFIIKNSENLFQYISPKLIDLPNEEFWAIYLNNRGKVIYSQRIASGGLTETAVDIRLIFKTAFEKNAVAIAVAHNHPSGSLAPSDKDKQLTTSILESGKILHIPLIEHIIVAITESGHPEYYSFYDNNII